MTVSLRAKSKARCPYSQRRRGQLSLWDHPPKPASGSAPVFSLVVGPLRSWLIPEPRSDRGPNRTWGPWCVFGLLHPSLWAGGPASSSDRPRKVPLSRGKINIPGSQTCKMRQDRPSYQRLVVPDGWFFCANACSVQAHTHQQLTHQGALFLSRKPLSLGGSATAVFEGRPPNIPGDWGIYRGRGVTAE